MMTNFINKLKYTRVKQMLKSMLEIKTTLLNLVNIIYQAYHKPTYSIKHNIKYVLKFSKIIKLRRTNIKQTNKKY